jgi:outer membrane protein assembly complex protein YaeT
MALKLREGQPFSDGRVADDEALVEDLYHRRGYASAKVQPTTEPRPTGNAAAQVPVTIRFDVFEAERIVVDSIMFTGNTAFDDAALRGKMALQVGAPYVPGQLRQDRDQVQAVYNDRGYESATVDARPEFNPQNTRASIVFTIREGPRVFVDHVLIVGNVRTDAGTIERELQIKPGDPFSLSSISESQRRLMALGLFRRVRIGELRHGTETARDLLVTLEEAAATTIGYGVGGEGRLLPVPQAEAGGAAAARFQVLPRAFFEYGRRNLFGKPRSVNVFSSVSVPLNQTRTTGRLTEYRLLGTYREPRFFDTATDGLLNATIEQQIRSSFTFRREGITAQAGRRLTRDVSVTAAYQIQRTELVAVAVNVADSDVQLIKRLFSTEPLRLSGFSASIIRDTRDDAVNPGSGRYLTANGQVDAVAIGSQVGFAKSFFRAQTFHTLPRSNGVVVAGNAILGMAADFNTEKPIPEPERFFAGGDTTNRGFALDTLGVRHEPSDPQRDTIDKNGFPIGGDATVVLMGELRVPVRGGLSVVGFLDSGNVFQRVSQVDLTELRGAVGFGVRYRSPFGPLRVDLGFKTHVAEFLCPTTDDPAKRCPESRPALHISFGQAF